MPVADVGQEGRLPIGETIVFNDCEAESRDRATSLEGRGTFSESGESGPVPHAETQRGRALKETGEPRAGQHPGASATCTEGEAGVRVSAGWRVGVREGE